VTFEELGPAEELPPEDERRQGLRLAASLVGIGLVIGLLVAVGAIVLGGFAQTEDGLCRVTLAPCSELSLTSVESLSDVDLPDGTEVVSGYALELADLLDFRAHVVLPADGESSLTQSYTQVDEPLVDVPDGIEQVTYWVKNEYSGSGTPAAARGIDGAGRVVILFDIRLDLS